MKTHSCKISLKKVFPEIFLKTFLKISPKVRESQSLNNLTARNVCTGPDLLAVQGYISYISAVKANCDSTCATDKRKPAMDVTRSLNMSKR